MHPCTYEKHVVNRFKTKCGKAIKINYTNKIIKVARLLKCSDLAGKLLHVLITRSDQK